MQKFEIVALSAAVGIVAVRLYQKYLKRKKDGALSDTKDSMGSFNSSSAKNDDYEPYAKK